MNLALSRDQGQHPPVDISGYNHVVVVYYESGDKYIGPHTDKTKDFDPASSIVCVTLMENANDPPRSFCLQEVNSPHLHPRKELALLRHGSIYSLGLKTNGVSKDGKKTRGQNVFKHSILKTTKAVSRRVSITFRKMQTFELTLNNPDRTSFIYGPNVNIRTAHQLRTLAAGLASINATHVVFESEALSVGKVPRGARGDGGKVEGKVAGKVIGSVIGVDMGGDVGRAAGGLRQ